SKKGNQWHFGMKLHIGTDTAHGLVHTMEATTGKISDYSMSAALLHGDAATAHGDRGYADKSRELDHPHDKNAVCPRSYAPLTPKPRCETRAERWPINRLGAGVRRG